MCVREKERVAVAVVKSPSTARVKINGIVWMSGPMNRDDIAQYTDQCCNL